MYNLLLDRKLCTKCLIDKHPLNFHKHQMTRDKLSPVCRDCCRKYRQANRKRRNATERKRYSNYPDKFRNANYKCKYGITLDQYNNILAVQNNKCAICKTDKLTRGNKNFQIDHCHISGKVRGLLCFPCNSALGQFKDSIDILAEAKKYLEINNETKI